VVAAVDILVFFVVQLY